jgi:methylenetetrahydrofolate reductase (NADPH)
MMMTSASPQPMAARTPMPNPAHKVVAFTNGWSLEATRPSDIDIAALRTILSPRAPVYLSAVPTRDPNEQIDAAIRLHAAGFAPVPHVAVRSFATTAALDTFLARMAAEAGVRRVLVIGGDRDSPAGAFRSALEAIDSGVLQRHGITEIGIAGYPDGHARIPQPELDRALIEKIEIATQIGLGVHVVTQFSFDAKPIIAWIVRLRDFGIEQEVRIGLAGPTSAATLLRYARRCGVRASAQGLARQAGLAKHLFGMSTPDALVRALADAYAAGQLGTVVPHFFSFGGIAATARWASAAAAGRIALDGTGGFQVTPPTP